MRTLLIILVVLIIVGFAGYYTVKNSLKKLSISKPKFIGSDLINLFSGKGDATTTFTVNVSTTITNNNNFSIPVDKLHVEFSYNGSVIGQSTIPHVKFTIPKNGTISISENVTLYPLKATGIFTELLANRPVTLFYTVTGVLFGIIPLKFTDKFTYSK